MGWTSRTSNPALSLVRPPGPSADRRRLCVISDKGLVWSINWLNCDDPKNSRTAAAAGLAAVKPGVLASDVDRATRKVIEDAGYGDKFRHRTGHSIGLDVHEYPFISEEDQTPLETGMTFTIEPSIFWPGRVGARIEDIIVVTENGGEKLNEYSEAFVTVDSASSTLDSGVGGCAHHDHEPSGCMHQDD